MTAALLVYLANVDRPRRPGQAGSRTPQLVDFFAEIGALDGDADAADHLGGLPQVASDIADALVAGRFPPPTAALNAIAEAATSFPRLTVDPAAARLRLDRVQLTPDPIPAAAERLVTELVTTDLTRIKQCARPECHLVFVDDTRSRTQRWHAETPCGQLERQRRHRAR